MYPKTYNMNKKPLDGMVYYELRTRGYLEQDYDEYLIKSSGLVILSQDGEDIKKDDREIIIGEFSYYYMDTVNPNNLYEQLDSEEQYLGDMATEMVDEDGEYTKKFSFMEYTNSLIILNTVELKEEYRGMGIMKGLIQFFRSYYEGATIILKAHPMGELTDKEFTYSKKKVIQSYEKCGFKRVTKTSPYMYNMGGTIIP